MVAPRKPGSTTAVPSLASTSRVSPGLAPTSALAVGDRTVLEANLRLQAELDLLEFVQGLPVRADERQVRREIIAELGGPFQLGHDLAVAFEEARELLVDMLVGELGDRAA